MTWLRRKFVLTIALLGASLTSACSSVSYMPNASLRGDDTVILHDEDARKAPQKFGAFRLVSPAAGDSLDAEPQERLFILKRSGKSYMAETLLFDHSDDPHATFEKSFFSFGTNRETRAVGFTLRFVY